MLHFDSDYMEGAHPRILERLSQINLEKNPGYGLDPYCDSAKEKLRAACGTPDAAIYFLPGGTQANATVISGLLRPWQGVLAAATGHISTHEAGAIEAGGHKILTLPQTDGKLSAAAVEAFLKAFYADENHDHMPAPGMVYITHPTEYGTVYSKAELEALRAVCDGFDLPLYLDGARLGYGLMAGGDLTLRDIAALTDVFYIGGTKVGALFGEAVIVRDPALLPHFFTLIKQHGGLLAKGWLMGLQFDTLFTDGLYYRISLHAVEMARNLKHGLAEKGIPLYLDSPTNQQFLLLEDRQLQRLKQFVSYGFWEKPDETHTVIRLATSWATLESQVDVLLELL